MPVLPTTAPCDALGLWLKRRLLNMRFEYTGNVHFCSSLFTGLYPQDLKSHAFIIFSGSTVFQGSILSEYS